MYSCDKYPWIKYKNWWLFWFLFQSKWYFVQIKYHCAHSICNVTKNNVKTLNLCSVKTLVVFLRLFCKQHKIWYVGHNEVSLRSVLNISDTVQIGGVTVYLQILCMLLYIYIAFLKCNQKLDQLDQLNRPNIIVCHWANQYYH